MVQLLSKLATHLLWSDKGVLAIIDSGTTIPDINLRQLIITDLPKRAKIMDYTHSYKMAYSVPMFDT